MKSTDTQNKDLWDKITIVLSHGGKLLVTVLLAHLGNEYTSMNREAQAQEANTRLYSELMSSRERSENDRRTKMLEPLVQSLNKITQDLGSFKHKASLDAASLKTFFRSRLVSLDLLVSNFHDSLQLKPLFSNLQGLIGESVVLKNRDKNELNFQLEEIALKTIHKQQSILERVGKKFDLDLRFGSEALHNPLVLERKIIFHDVEYSFALLCLTQDLQRKRIQLQLTIHDNTIQNNKIDTVFWLSYFDFPMLDNLYLSHSTRCALVLRHINEIAATITVTIFPESHSSLKEKMYYDDIVNALVQK